MRTTQPPGAAREKLMNDLRAVIQDAEQLLGDTEQQTEHGYTSALAQLERKLKNARAELGRLEQRIAASGKDVVQTADRYVGQHPWQAVAAGLGAGLLLGLVVGRK